MALCALAAIMTNLVTLWATTSIAVVRQRYIGKEGLNGYPHETVRLNVSMIFILFLLTHQGGLL